MVAKRCGVKVKRQKVEVACGERARFALTGGFESCDRHLAKAVRLKEKQQREAVSDTDRRVSVWVLPLDRRP